MGLLFIIFFLIELVLAGMTLGLFIIGGFCTFATFVTPHHARSAPYCGFCCLLACGGSVLLASSAGSLAYELSHSDGFALAGVLGGYFVGGLAGADMGRRAARHYDLKVLPRRGAAPGPYRLVP